MTEAPRPFPNLWQAVALVLALFAMEFVAGMIIRPFISRDLESSITYVTTVTVIANVTLLAWVLSYQRMTLQTLIHPASHSVKATLALLTIPLLLIVPGLVVVVSIINSLVITLYPMPPDLRESFERLMSGGDLALVLVCIVGPIFEELLFRGVILRGFLRLYSRATAITASALLFGMAHMNLYQFVAGIVLGLVLGWLFERSQSLWPGMVLHGGYNAASALSYLLAKRTSAGASMSPSLWQFVLIVGAAAAGVTLLRKLLETKDGKTLTPRR